MFINFAMLHFGYFNLASEGNTNAENIIGQSIPLIINSEV